MDGSLICALLLVLVVLLFWCRPPPCSRGEAFGSSGTALTADETKWLTHSGKCHSFYSDYGGFSKKDYALMMKCADKAPPTPELVNMFNNFCSNTYGGGASAGMFECMGGKEQWGKAKCLAFASSYPNALETYKDCAKDPLKWKP